LGFGGAPAGLTNYLQDYDPHDASQRRSVQSALETALELGVTYFDTAPGYGDGASETIFGEVLAHAPQELFVATKINPTQVNLDERDVRHSVESSLRRLRRDRLDLIQIHGTSYTTAQADAILAPEGMLAQLQVLQAEGLVRFIGFTSEDNNAAVFRFIHSGAFQVMQIAYNLLHQHPYEPTRPFGSLLEAEAQEMGICTMRALTSGIFQKWMRMVHPENDFDYSPALLQFVLSNPLVDVVLVGMRTADEVRRNVAVLHDVASRTDIDELHRKYPDTRNP
jgi:aryl-alcohol dehydrogenase-like predicted oxidoreductase